jgi:hypothetical protein
MKMREISNMKCVRVTAGELVRVDTGVRVNITRASITERMQEYVSYCVCKFVY